MIVIPSHRFPLTRCARLGLIALLAMLFLAGCATGPAFVAAPPPPKDKALIYVYRQGGFRPGAAGTHHLMLNHKQLTILRHGGYFPALAEPGPVALGLVDVRPFRTDSVNGPEAVSTTFTAEAGKTYYVKFLLGGWSTYARLEKVDAAVGAAEIRDCKLLDAKSP
jgi:hypothetical protein